MILNNRKMLQIIYVYILYIYVNYVILIFLTLAGEVHPYPTVTSGRNEYFFNRERSKTSGRSTHFSHCLNATNDVK